MSDIGDRAQEADERFLQQALRKQQGGKGTPRPSRTHCIDCEEPIPQARREKQPGCQRCVECQDIHEHWRAL